MVRISKKRFPLPEEQTYEQQVDLPVYEIESPQPRRRFPKKIALVLLVLLLVGASAYAFYKHKENPAAAGERELAQTIEKVSRLIVLPLDEEPTLATVSDPERLKSNEFFKNARLGDKVLIYAKARKAILYSPELDRIVEVAPLALQGSESADQSEPVR